MKSVFAVLAIVLAVTLPVGAAATGGTGLRANVPFDFYYGVKLFPAGEYNIVNDTQVTGVITLKSVDGRISGLVLGIPQERSTNSEKRPSLLFTKYGDGKSYLREVRHPFLRSSYFPPSRTESQAVKRLIRGATPSPVIVLALSAEQPTQKGDAPRSTRNLRLKHLRSILDNRKALNLCTL